MASQVMSISLSPEEVELLNKIAAEQKRSRSQIVKEALALYEFDMRWRKVRAAGDQIAKRLGVESDDDVQQLFG